MLRLSFARTIAASLLASAACLAALPVAAQQEPYPSTSDDVIVNPIPGSGVLLYPGGKFGRVTHPLLQPGAPYPGNAEPPIHLHMPYKHVVAHRVKKTPAAPPTAVANVAPPAPAPVTNNEPAAEPSANLTGLEDVTAPQQPPPQKPAPARPLTQRPAVAQAAKPAPQPSAATPQQLPGKPMMAQAPKPSMPPGFKPVVAQVSRPAPAVVQKPQPQAPKPVVAQAAKPTPPPAGSAAPVPFSFSGEPSAPASAASQQTRVASNQPPPAHTNLAPPPASAPPPSDQGPNGLVRQSQILFGPGAPDPVPEAIDAIKGLASPLNSALAAGASRVEVIAYGGARGDKSSDARRLSLRRAIVIRQLLIDGGVPSARIDLKAMGGTNDAEPTDRVDIFTKA